MTREITEEMLDVLRERIRPYVAERTYKHILGVEREAKALASVFLPEKVNLAGAAGLLHDITKNESPEKQLQYFAEFGIINEIDPLSPKLYHSKTATGLIRRDFPDFSDEELISAIWWHTTGHNGMTVFEAIIYLADYIEETRTYDDCIALRHYFWDNMIDTMSEKEKLLHLYKTMVKSFDMTISVLMKESALIDPYTPETRNYYLRLINNFD